MANENENGNGNQQQQQPGQELNNNAGNNGAATSTTQTQEIDYEKLAGMISERNARAEKSVMKSYFGTLGLSEEEAKAAAQAYKQQQGKQQQDSAQALQQAQQQAEDYAKRLQAVELNSAAYKEALALGVQPGNVDYLIRMADLSGAVGENGDISAENIKATLAKVLDDVPALKAQPNENAGFAFGADRQNQQQQQAQENAALRRAMGLN